LTLFQFSIRSVVANRTRDDLVNRNSIFDQEFQISMAEISCSADDCVGIVAKFGNEMTERKDSILSNLFRS
jgi:hypothetical protein